MELDEMIRRLTEATDADHNWLGSDEHLALVQAFVASRIPGIIVTWIKPGERSFVEAGEIGIELPLLPSDLRRGCRLHGAMVVHEVHHSIYTNQDPLMAEAMAAALRNDYSEREELGHTLFNWLEDARIGQRVHDHLPEDEPFVSELYQASLEQMEQVYERTHHEEPWARTPRDEDAQFRIALAERIYAGDRGSALSPRVATIVNDVAPVIERATAALNTNDAREGALEIVDHLAKLPPAAAPSEPIPAVGRNDQCPCGSGLKYKKCHGR